MNHDNPRPRATFTALTDVTADDAEILGAEFVRFAGDLPDRVLQHLLLLAHGHGGFPVDRLTHSLQSAQLAYEDGRDEEYVVCALLHDIGDTLGTYNHPDIAAAILKPFVSEANHWMVAHHGIFQGYYFFHHLGMDRNLRDNFKASPHYDQTEEFCAKFDGPAFDAKAEFMKLDELEPMLRRVLAQPKNTIYKMK